MHNIHITKLKCFSPKHYQRAILPNSPVLTEISRYAILHILTFRYPSVLPLLALIIALTSSTVAWLVWAGARVALVTNAGRRSSMCWDFYTRERERERERGREFEHFQAKLVRNGTSILTVKVIIFHELTSFPMSMLGTDLIIFPALSPTESGIKREGSDDSDRKLAITWASGTFI